jgi:hypothetical protein
MEEAGHAFLKQQNESLPSSTILEIVDDLEGKLFVNFTKLETPQDATSTADPVQKNSTRLLCPNATHS